MAKVCDICGRKAMVSMLRSHSNRATKTRQHVNLQTKVIDGSRRRICARCLKTLAKKAS